MNINEVIKNMEEDIERTSCVYPKETPEMLEAIKKLKDENEQLEFDLDIKNSGTHTLDLLVKVDELKAELKKFYDNRFEADKLFIYAGKLKEILK